MLASVALRDPYSDFYLSRQAMNCTPATLQWYAFTASVFLALRAGMNALHLQMVDEDLLAEHKAPSPVDNLKA